MLKGKTIKQGASLVLVGKQGGITVIPSPTPLTRLHYFDGKFLRARDLELEQNYLRQLVALSNQAGGSGVVHGFDCDLEGNSLSLGPGLAIDGQGRVLLLPEARDFDLAALIEASRQRYADSLPQPIPFPGGFSACCDAAVDEPGTVSEGASFYLISICHAEALCGEEDVFGKLCAAACSTTTERPYTLEGVAVRALPLELGSLLPTSTASPVPITGKHLRSRAAAAYFEDERKKVASLISEGGLKSAIWCHGAAAAGAGCVPLALVARAGSQTLFLDTWTARRERIETPPRRFWAGILAMRPWDVYLAHVLQFQCQLACCLAKHRPEEADDPCRRAQELLRQTAEQLAVLIRKVESGKPAAGAKRLDYDQLETIRGRLADAAGTAVALPTANRLLHCGFVELPSAGYLPVDPGAQQTVNEQVRAMMGDSVDLRFCVVRPDFVPHAFEEAQHMDRISLLHGYDHPTDKPKVDILVPYGQIEENLGKVPGEGYVWNLTVNEILIHAFGRLLPSEDLNTLEAGSFLARLRQPAGQAKAKSRKGKSGTGKQEISIKKLQDIAFFGAARGELTAGGGLAFYYAGRTQAATPPAGKTSASAAEALASGAIWLETKLGADPFDLDINDTVPLQSEVVLAEEADGRIGVFSLRLAGDLVVASRTQSGAISRLTLRVAGSLALQVRSDNGIELSAVAKIQESLKIDRKAGSGFGATHSLFFGLLKLFDFPVDAEHSHSAPGKARLEGAIDATQTVRLDIFTGDRLADAKALTPGHPAHDASITALGRLAVGLDDAGFADSRARRLFPPVKNVPTDLIVRARLPWVLFHRRRDKVCAAATPKDQTVSRRFRLFHIELLDRDQVEVLLELLQKGSGLDNYNPEFVATVEFAAGLASVQNAFEPLRDSWDDAAEDGARLVFGALAGQGQVINEGGTLARARLEALAGVLDPVTPDDQPEFELLDAIHPDLPANGLDGSIVYATLVAAQAATVCQTVYLLPSAMPRSLLDSQLKTVATAGFGAANFPNLNGIPLTAVLFKDGTAEALPGSLDDAVMQVKNKLPPPSLPTSELLVVPIVAKSVPAAERPIHTARSTALRNALGSTQLDPLVVDGGTAPLPNSCPSLSLLVFISSFKP